MHLIDNEHLAIVHVRSRQVETNTCNRVLSRPTDHLAEAPRRSKEGLQQQWRHAAPAPVTATSRLKHAAHLACDIETLAISELLYWPSLRCGFRQVGSTRGQRGFLWTAAGEERPVCVRPPKQLVAEVP
jgi:hypothetical protein